jgi:hypothetical protein
MTGRGSKVSRLLVEFSNGDTYTMDVKDSKNAPTTSPCCSVCPIFQEEPRPEDEEVLCFCTKGKMHVIVYDKKSLQAIIKDK